MPFPVPIIEIELHQMAGDGGERHLKLLVVNRAVGLEDLVVCRPALSRVLIPPLDGFFESILATCLATEGFSATFSAFIGRPPPPPAMEMLRSSRWCIASMNCTRICSIEMETEVRNFPALF